MKKSLIAVIFVSMLFLNGCSFNLSNLDVQKLNLKAQEYMQAGQYDKAASRLESIIELNPQFPEAYYNLGIAYYNMNEYQKAIGAFEEAILHNPEFADAYYSCAVAFEDLAYEIKEKNAEEKDEQKIKENEFLVKENLKSAKNYYENYLKFKSDAQDKDEVTKKTEQLEKELLEDTIEE